MSAKFIHFISVGILVFGGIILNANAQEEAFEDNSSAALEAGSNEDFIETEEVTEDAEMVEVTSGMSVWEIIQSGGIIGYLIIALSVVGIGLIFENYYSVRRSVLMPMDIVEEVERLFQEEAFEEALELCDAEQNLLTNMIGAGLSKVALGYESIIESMASALEEGSTALHQKVNYLSLIGNIAPMIGLMGTVQGMIAAFQTIAEMGGAPKPAVLADDISLALVTTLLGLIVAIPMLSFHMFLKNRIVKIVLEATAISSELMERFKT